MFDCAVCCPGIDAAHVDKQRQLDADALHVAGGCFGIPIISVATARELDRLYARYKAGLPVTDAELSALLYAVAVAISFAQKELYREPADRRHRRAASLGAI